MRSRVEVVVPRRVPRSGHWFAFTVAACTPTSEPPAPQPVERVTAKPDVGPPSATPQPADIEPVDPPATESATRPEPEPEPEPEPVLESPPKLGPNERPTLRVAYEDFAYDGTCMFSVEVHGFPAVSTDGTQILTARREVEGGGENHDATLAIRWLDAPDAKRVKRAELPFQIQEDMSEAACKKLRRRVANEVRRWNRRWKRDGWRSMSPLWARYGDKPADGRGTELLWRSGEIIVRVPHVKVLMREPAPWKEQDPRSPSHLDCDGDIELYNAAVDRTTRLVTVEYSNLGGSTSDWCFMANRTAVLEASDALLAWLDRGPT